MDYSLSKGERLYSQKTIENLFKQGKFFFAFPVKVVYLLEPCGEEPFPVQVAFSVSKKNFKQAVKRNLLKRRMREAYRLNKTSLHEAVPPGERLAIMFIYVVKEECNYAQIEKGIKHTLSQLSAIAKKEND